MTRITLRRLGVAAIAPALAAGMVVAAPSAQAAPVPASSYSYSAARWLADQLTDGLVVTSGTKRYGQTLDIFFALDGLGVRERDAASIIDAFEAPQAASAYTTGEAFGDAGSRYVGATSKLATAVIDAGEDPTSFGGRDLVADVNGFIQASGPQQGRATDVSNFGDNSNTLGQSFAVQVLASAASPKLDDATDYLLKQQCSNGAFRTYEYTEAVPDQTYPVAAVDLVCGEGPTTGDDELSVDTTALALQSLTAAKTAGVTGLDDDIADAVTWLKSVQSADGSFQDLGTSNSSSTGYAATALSAVGENGAAGSAAAWLVAQQVTDSVAEGTGLANELGAIAPDRSTLAAGTIEGISDAQRIRWVIATAQGAAGVNAQLPASALGVAAPSGFVQGGKQLRVSVAGLARGEKFSVRVAGGSTVAATADASGQGAALVAAPTSSGSAAISVTGSRSVRAGSTTIQVLGATKFSTRVKSAVKKNKRQQIIVKGLAAGEKVTIRYRGKTIRTSKATSKGTYSYSFKVGSSKGKKTVSIRGAFANRTGAKSFRIK